MSGDYPPLPGVLADIAEVVGRDGALDLALALGGQRVYVPSEPRLHPHHRLCTVLGAAAARLIAEHWPGETLEIPMARRALVQRLGRRGLSNAAIGRQLNLRIRTVRRYRN